MQASVEISLYPLAHSDYKKEIWAFVTNLRNKSGLEVVVNGMSTQVFGEYDLVMTTVTEEIKRVHQALDSSVFILKIINADRSLTSENRKEQAKKY